MTLDGDSFQRVHEHADCLDAKQVGSGLDVYRQWREQLQQAPTLIIVGEDDAFCTHVVAEMMHAGIRNSKLIVYKNCGHLPWIEQKENFLDEMRDWWDRE